MESIASRVPGGPALETGNNKRIQLEHCQIVRSAAGLFCTVRKNCQGCFRHFVLFLATTVATDVSDVQANLMPPLMALAIGMNLLLLILMLAWVLLLLQEAREEPTKEDGKQGEVSVG